MNDERLDQLALGYINQDWTFSPECILKAWDHSGNHRISLAFHNRKE